jgi:hypothetical protein
MAMTPRTSPYLQRLFDGPIDVVGDVHGELDALLTLMRTLGYDERGEHPQGRRLVLLGDLCDRGPDSPGVLALARRMIEAGRAQAVLGNHELNLLREVPKHGNGWFFEADHDRARGEFGASRKMPVEERAEVQDFLRELPVALERDDLRVVHAVWDDASFARLGSELASWSPERIHRDDPGPPALQAELARLEPARAVEMGRYGSRLNDRDEVLPLLEAVGRSDALWQRGNPMRVVTSGLETLAARPYFAGGTWRMTDRVKWWDEYDHQTPVLFGHYWRWMDPAARGSYSKGEPDLFEGAAPNEWIGKRRNVFCTDFSVGARYKEREIGWKAPWRTRLAAVRWPERELVDDHGERFALE